MNKSILHSSTMSTGVAFILALAIGLLIGLQSKHFVQHYVLQLFVSNNQASQADNSYLSLNNLAPVSSFVASQDGCGCPSCCSVQNM